MIITLTGNTKQATNKQMLYERSNLSRDFHLTEQLVPIPSCSKPDQPHNGIRLQNKAYSHIANEQQTAFLLEKVRLLLNRKTSAWYLSYEATDRFISEVRPFHVAMKPIILHPLSP